jgi:hypothetical protein
VLNFILIYLHEWTNKKSLNLQQIFLIIFQKKAFEELGIDPKKDKEAANRVSSSFYLHSVLHGLMNTIKIITESSKRQIKNSSVYFKPEV